jgi:hypothetical protein
MPSDILSPQHMILFCLPQPMSYKDKLYTAMAKQSVSQAETETDRQTDRHRNHTVTLYCRLL